MPLTRSMRNSSRLLGMAIDHVLNEIDSATWATLKKRLKQIEYEFVKAARGNAFVALETKRRVAEAVLLVRIFKKCSSVEMKATFRRLRALGFTNIDKRMSYTFLFARECSAIGEARYALRVMDELLESLHDYPIRQKKKAREVVDQICQEIRNGNQLE